MAAGQVGGFAQAGFEAARAAFEDNFARGEEIGASFCATVEGETVVDLWGGWADLAATKPWTAETIACVYSTTKTMTALCALLLADKGELSFEAPVARYWPQFAANGKGAITVAQVMSHSSGLSGWRPAVRGEDFYDWEKVTAALAAQAPLWPPGSASGYHVYTYGFLIGELVRRITGQSLGAFFRREIAEPIGADFWIGLPASEDARVAELKAFELPASLTAAPPQLSDIQQATLADTRIEIAWSATREWRAAEIPAVNGHGNARSIAQIHALLANGGVAGGKRLMSEAGCRRALELQVSGPDLVMRNLEVSFGLGFGLPSPILRLQVPSPNTLFWGGSGGSLVLIDLDRRATFAYAMNRMTATTVGDERSFRICRALWAALGA
ncbi:MAG TPA: serine hydrolase domain-containing protein [Caulobacteraceae bacterium]|nr:serine hydrolase domain-containing protein [Caulobacteraceae bacterium]